MPRKIQQTAFEFRWLYDASASLLGYFVHTWYVHYLSVIAANLKRWHEIGLIETLAEPTEGGKFSVLFDFQALDMEKISYINGIYFYILSCHKGANHRLMNRHDGKQVLYLRGYDYEGSISPSSGQAVGFSSLDTFAFNAMLGKHICPHFQVFKVLSPRDVYWETVAAQRKFYGEFADMIHLARYPFLSVYLNALHWKEGVADLLDRMDHFVVYVSSITESVLWELEQLDSDDRRGRVTVVFDEKAIAKKKTHLGFEEQLGAKFGAKVIWTKKGSPTAKSVTELRDQLSRKFHVTSPDAFEADIEQHRRRIANGSGPLGPGTREIYLDFRFHPALDPDRLNALHDFSAEVQAWITGCVGKKGITCLPLFLNQVQLRIFMTLLMGEHHETGRALAAYAAVMEGALDYYTRPGKKVGDLAKESREASLETLRSHLNMANHIAWRMLSYGKSHQFDDFTAVSEADFKAAFDPTKAAVAQFFSTAAARHAT